MRNLAFYGPFLPTSGPTPMSAKRWKMYPHNALTPLAVRNFSASFWRFTRPNVPLRGEIKCRKLNFSWVQISSFEIFYRHNPSQKPPRANKKNFKWFEAIFLLNFNEMSDPLFSEFAPQFKMASIMWNSSILHFPRQGSSQDECQITKIICYKECSLFSLHIIILTSPCRCTKQAWGMWWAEV